MPLPIAGPGLGLVGRAVGGSGGPVPVDTSYGPQLPSRTFKNRKEAVKFLAQNPDFVRARFGNLSKGSQKLLADAGYKVSVAWKNGKPAYTLSHKGKTIHTYSQLPESDGKQYLTIQKPKPGSKPKPAPSGGGGGQTAAPAPIYTDSGPSMDYSALAGMVGIDPKLFQGLNPNVGNLIPLATARRGAQTMGNSQQEALIRSLVGDSFSRQESLLGQERSRLESQNRMNLDNIRGWYDQVMKSQGVAMERDAAFGTAAVDSMTDATTAVVSALGGEANQGSYVAGAAGQENIGNLGAISQIQNQYNSDMAPLLAAEGAGALAREQALGSSRSRDLSMRLAELQSNRGTAEAELRFNLWQANNEILNQRLQNELAIRQSNTGVRQQQFNNRVGLRQMMIAAQAGQAENVTDIASVAQRDADSRRDAQIAAGKEAFRQQMDQAKEAGRNYRAQLSAAGRKKQGTYANATSNTRDSAWNDIVDVLDGQKLNRQQAQKLAMAVVQGYGWSAQNPAVAALITTALREAGY